MALINALRSFVRRAATVAGEAGASLVEYTLLVALIAAVAIGAIAFLGGSAADTMCNTGAKIAAGDSAAVPVAGDCD
jgi:Flp pilus assembly pilin Flp